MPRKKRPEEGSERQIETSIYFLVSGGQSGRTSIGFPSLCTVGAAEFACPPADGRIALFSTLIEVSAVLALPEVVPEDDVVLQLVSGLSEAAGVCAIEGVAANSATKAATMI
jgi:hypothetical protein